MDNSCDTSHRPSRGYYKNQDRYRRDERSHLHDESLRQSQSIRGGCHYHHNLLEDSISRGGMGRVRGRGRYRRAGRNCNYGDRRGVGSLDSLCEYTTDKKELRYSGSKHHRRDHEFPIGLGELNNTDKKELCYSGSKHHRRDREFPIGLGELNKLLTLPADAVILELLSKKSGYQLLLEQDILPNEKFECLLAVLSYSTSTQSNKENLHELFIRTCDQKFMDKLCNYTITVKRLYPDKAENVFTHLFVFLEVYASAMTSLAIDRLPNLLDSCISSLTLLQRKGLIPEKLLKQYEELQEMLTEAAKRWVQEQQLDSDRRKQRNDMYELEPPDDFKELSVLPTPIDFISFERPFLRKNIVQGQYRDDEHYLDVQFRLLREDFIRPLRNGLKDFRSNKNFKTSDVRIYRNARILGFETKNHKLVFNVQLDIPKKFKIENSKRMLYGNLLCFSNDGFKTLLLASVAGRDSENLKKGIIQVLFESNVMSYELCDEFMMIESKAYYMPYKHVLKALQSMSGEAVPLSRYVIRIQPNVEPPKYLHEEEQYDLRVIKDSNMMKTAEAYSRFFFCHRNKEEPRQDQWVHLKNVYVLRDLRMWPSEDDLCLDSSQRRALRSALTRQLAIIQGPPGTGKTFLGLKIAQVLLHNSKVWKNEDNPTPILVVCYTNHALDQFLEGMTTYTSNIVRVGSRTKSEKISQFQINYLSRFLRGNRMIPSAVHVRNNELQLEIHTLEYEIKEMRNIIDMCSNVQGIFPLDILVSKKIVPAHLMEQFEVNRSDKKLTGWLLFNIQSENIREYVDSFQPAQPSPSDIPSMLQDMSEMKDGEIHKSDIWEDSDETDENIWKDAEVLHDLEECNRQLEDDEIEEIQINDLYYETTLDSLEYEMNLAMTALTRDENDAEAYFIHNICASQREALKIGLSLQESPEEVCVLEELQTLNIWSLDFPKRWCLYKYWLKKLKDKIVKRLQVAESNYQKKTGALEEVRNQTYLYIMRSASIVGMTTTGAAQYNSLMKDLAPAIVIIEEAAEILESHVITSLTSSCQHLIMIGDHQQLRPSATVYELATKYGLDTSLFERMIKNGLAYETLEYQHRMKPCISSLLVPSVYPHLKNHPSVDTYQSIKGITKDVFFISHQIHEKEDTDGTTSHENMYEAELLMGLCRHLILQGYFPKDITILTPYTGQFFLLRKIQRMHQACNGVEIQVVDNFQGEENKIILLSLVRSNVGGKVGFLRTSNRICVALSRAKCGLYITGNMELLSASSELWKKVKQDLTNMDSIGNSLTLKCQNHPDQLISVSSGKDFLNKSPEGGCLKNCGKLLPNCNHTCPKICHIDDQDHKEYRCKVPCPKILCNLGHSCPRMCWEKCAPCKALVERLLPCGHSHRIFCHISPLDYYCPTQVEKEITVCQHKVIMPCHQDPDFFQCPVDCDSRLDCGHMCREKCHHTIDPDHLNYDCLQRCTRLNAGCSQNHPCLKMCYEDCGACLVKVTKDLPCGHKVKDVCCSSSPESIKCLKNCKKTLTCGHQCKKLCHQSCETCLVKVMKIVPECNHSAWIACGLPATTDMCDGSCQKKLPCGHPCSARCKEVCTVKCTHPVTTTTKCPKSHSIMVPCHLSDKVNGEDAWKYCIEPCNQLLKCGHNCVGTCGSCFQGRLHVSCRKQRKKLLVCGHISQYPCSANCPPCQEQCQWRCEHSQCRKKCGVPCVVCQEKCEWRCVHQKCKKKCGEKCSRKPCTQACPKKLACGHSCVGFCGDPCPPLCRTCDVEELSEFSLMCLEGDDDARFVFLEDCGHTIEVQGLEGWLHQETAEIGMKTCPKCRKPIYNNRRYQNLILETYNTVKAVKSKYFTSLPRLKRKEIDLILQDPEIDGHFVSQTRELQKRLGVNSANKSHKQEFISRNQLILIQFQAQVLKKATDILKCQFESNTQKPRYSRQVRFFTRSQLTKHGKCLQARVEAIVELVMDKNSMVSTQMIDEVSCELQRLVILPAYWTVQEKFNSNSSARLQTITAQLEKLMDPTIKFDDEVDTKVRDLLKESEQYVGSLTITHSKKIKILQGVELIQGYWYKCPKGHIFFDKEFQEAMGNSRCPYCNSHV